MEVKLGYKQSEVGLIPEEWEVCPVRQKGEVVTGKALAVHALGPQRPYLRTKNVFDGRIDIDDVLTMPMTDEQFAQFQIRNGDVLLNEGQSIELVGRCAMYQDEYPEPCAIQNALLRFRARTGVSEKFASYLFRNCQHTGVFARIALQTTSVAHLGGSRFEKLRLAWPTEPEQRAIATALSDVDGLLGGLDRLIAKKRDLKQAAMQQLLTGQTRLPGFAPASQKYKQTEVGVIPEDWRQDCIENFAQITTGSKNTQDRVQDGNYPFFVRSQTVERINTFSFDGEAVLTAGDGVGTGKVFHYINGKFDVHQRVYRMSNFAESVNGYFFYLYFSTHFYDRIMQMTAKSSVDSVRRDMIARMIVPLPPTLPEQTAIAEVLTEMDAELAGLEQRREKTRALKQAMMQELLTGRTRLV